MEYEELDEAIFNCVQEIVGNPSADLLPCSQGRVPTLPPLSACFMQEVKFLCFSSGFVVYVSASTTDTHIHMHSLLHTHMHTCMHIHTLTHTHSLSYICACTHIIHTHLLLMCKHRIPLLRYSWKNRYRNGQSGPKCHVQVGQC